MGIKNNILGILLLPFSFGFLTSFIKELFSIRMVGYGELAFFTGVIIYPLIHYFLIKPKFISTFAHESTHALWGVLFGARVKDLRVKKESGYVNLSKTNSIIRLAPYFFPLFTVLAILSTFFLRQEYLLWTFFLVGFTLSLHTISTIESLNTKQPDVYKTGVLFSLPFILISNLLVIILVLNFVSPENIGVMRFLKNGMIETFTLLDKIN